MTFRNRSIRIDPLLTARSQMGQLAVVRPPRTSDAVIVGIRKCWHQLFMIEVCPYRWRLGAFSCGGSLLNYSAVRNSGENSAEFSSCTACRYMADVIGAG